jgi:hypothetical protein
MTPPPCKIWGFHGSDYDEWRNIPEDAILHSTPMFIGLHNAKNTDQEDSASKK